MNKITFLLIITLMFFLVSVTQAQLNSIGIIGGYAKTNLIHGYLRLGETDAENNYVTGAQASFRLHKKWFLETELLYRQDGFSISYIDDIWGLQNKYTFVYEYLALPLKTSYRVGNQLQVFGSLGITPAMLLNSRRHSSNLWEDDVLLQVDGTDATPKIDLSGLVALGIRYQAGNWGIQLEGRFNRGLTNVRFSEIFSNQVDSYHQSWNLLLGISYVLNHKN